MIKILTKADIVEALYGHGFEHACSRVNEIVEDMLALMKQGIKDDDALLHSGSGKFDACEKESRKGRNPLPAEPITLPPRKVVVFRLSRKFRKELNGKEAGQSGFRHIVSPSRQNIKAGSEEGHEYETFKNF